MAKYELNLSASLNVEAPSTMFLWEMQVPGEGRRTNTENFKRCFSSVLGSFSPKYAKIKSKEFAAWRSRSLSREGGDAYGYI